MQNKTVALKEYLHKVSDVYHNNYLMQCLELIYVDRNRSSLLLSFINVNCFRGTSHWVFSSSRWEASCMRVTQCTILHFGNLAGAVLQHVMHRVSWYLHCAVLSDVCCEMRGRWINFFINFKESIYKTVN